MTIPANFNTDQIEATKKAIKLANLKLIHLLPESTAAAIAYNNKEKLRDSINLIFDLGGGSRYIFRNKFHKYSPIFRNL